MISRMIKITTTSILIICENSVIKLKKTLHTL